MGVLGGGHYTAHARVDDQWFCFDDARVSPVKASSISTAEAYVLYFEMMDGEPPPPTPVRQRPPPDDTESEDSDAVDDTESEDGDAEDDT